MLKPSSVALLDEAASVFLEVLDAVLHLVVRLSQGGFIEVQGESRRTISDALIGQKAQLHLRSAHIMPGHSAVRQISCDYYRFRHNEISTKLWRLTVMRPLWS